MKHNKTDFNFIIQHEHLAALQVMVLYSYFYIYSYPFAFNDLFSFNPYTQLPYICEKDLMKISVFLTFIEWSS